MKVFLHVHRCLYIYIKLSLYLCLYIHTQTYTCCMSSFPSVVFAFCRLPVVAPVKSPFRHLKPRALDIPDIPILEYARNKGFSFLGG